ncbi:MAG: type II toxin-antitoxin system RelE/ParE family toxin [Janthinobacterium lividum]
MAQDQPAAATAVGQNIRKTISHFARLSEAGRPGPVPSTREMIVPRLPFIIAYRVSTDDVDVLAILHAARNSPSSL